MAGLLVLVGTALAATFLIPQIIRLLRSRDSSGVSTVWAAFGVITNVAWLVYLGSRAMWLPALAPSLAVVTYGMLLLAILRVERTETWRWPLFYSSFLLLAGLSGLHFLGWVLAVTPSVQLAPEVIAVYRHPQPRGVSPATWALSASEAVVWAGYGALSAEPALIGYGLVTALGSVAILLRWWSVCCRGEIRRPGPTAWRRAAKRSSLAWTDG